VKSNICIGQEHERDKIQKIKGQKIMEGGNNFGE
jgi:hypothetical protein